MLILALLAPNPNPNPVSIPDQVCGNDLVHGRTHMGATDGHGTRQLSRAIVGGGGGVGG